MITSCVRFSLSAWRPKYYDVVFVGPLAGRLSKEIYHEFRDRISGLNISNATHHLEPTLIPMGGREILLAPTYRNQYPVLHSTVTRFIPEQNCLMVGDEKIFYNQLVYTLSQSQLT